MKEKITSPQEIIKSQLKSQKISKEYFGSYFGWDKKELKKFFKYKDKLDEETINKLTLFFKSPDDFWKNINDNYKTKLRKQSENLLDNLDKYINSRFVFDYAYLLVPNKVIKQYFELVINSKTYKEAMDYYDSISAKLYEKEKNIYRYVLQMKYI